MKISLEFREGDAEGKVCFEIDLSDLQGLAKSAKGAATAPKGPPVETSTVADAAPTPVLKSVPDSTPEPEETPAKPAPKKRGRKSALPKKPKEQEAEAEKPAAPAPAPAPAPADEGEPPALEKVWEVLMAIRNVTASSDIPRKLVQEIGGVETTKDLPATKYAAVLEAATAELAKLQGGANAQNLEV